MKIETVVAFFSVLFAIALCLYLIFITHDPYDRWIGMAGLIYLLK